MGKLRMQEYHCDECGSRFDELIKLPDDAPMSMDSCPQSLPCTECGGEAGPIISVPRLMNVALPDGTDRGDTWKQAREAAELRKKRRDVKPEKRGDIDKEIGKVSERLSRTAKQDRFRTQE